MKHSFRFGAALLHSKLSDPCWDKRKPSGRVWHWSRSLDKRRLIFKVSCSSGKVASVITCVFLRLPSYSLGGRPVPCCSSNTITNQNELRRLKVSLKELSSSSLSIRVPIYRIDLLVWSLNSISQMGSGILFHLWKFTFFAFPIWFPTHLTSDPLFQYQLFHGWSLAVKWTRLLITYLLLPIQLSKDLIPMRAEPAGVTAKS